MNLLRDEELVGLVKGGAFVDVSEPRDWYSIESAVQPSSIDLHVGPIYTPGAEKDAKGSPSNAARTVVLCTGETVLVETRESLALPGDVAAFGFPPTNISNKAVLMTNPGHVDPGFKGHLRFTLINMGRQNFTLRTGDRVATLLVVRLSKAAHADYGARKVAPVGGNRELEDQLDALGKDFLQVTLRARRAARAAVQRANVALPIITGVIGILITVATAYLLPSWKEAIRGLESRVAGVEASINVRGLESRLDQLEAWCSRLPSGCPARR